MTIKLTNLLPFAAFVCLVSASCKKTDAIAPSTEISADLLSVANLVDLDMADATALDDLNDEDVTVSGSSSSNSVVSGSNTSNSVTATCKVTTYSDPQKVYPYTQTVDFGTGCEIAPGLTYSGKKIYQQKADWRTAANGTLLTSLSYSNFKSNGLQVTGTRNVYIQSGAGTSSIKFRIVTNLTHRDAAGSTSTSVGILYRTLIAGYSTTTPTDDIYSFTGSFAGAEVHVPPALSKINGWRNTIDENDPVVRAATCPFRSQGTLNIDVIYIDQTVESQHLNYGTGTCDNNATLTIGAGTPQNVTLPFVFYNTKL